MKSTSSSLRATEDSLDAELETLEDTIGLPVLVLPQNMNDCNDEDAGPSPRTAQRQSAYLIELGDSINKNLERIAVALEHLQRKPGRSATTRKTATSSKKTAKKTARKTTASSKKQRKKAAKKKTSRT
jgi:hypothetical protein